MKPTTFPAKEKKGDKKSEKREKERKQKAKVFLCMPELSKLIFCIWNRRLH